MNHTEKKTFLSSVFITSRSYRKSFRSGGSPNGAVRMWGAKEERKIKSFLLFREYVKVTF